MNLLIKIYILLCVALILFDLAFLFAKSTGSQEFYHQNPKLAQKIRTEITLRRKTGAFSPGFTAELSRMLTRTKNLITLQAELEQAPDAVNWFRTMIFERIDAYQQKSDYEQAFYAYVISCFDYTDKPLPHEFANRFLTFLDSKSLYTFSNTMNAIYRFGQMNLILLAMDKADERGRFYHKKLLTDGLLASKVDQAELTAELVRRFYQYSPHIQESLLDVFRMGQGDATKLCMELMLCRDCDEQLRYSAMRYFIKHPIESSRRYFLEILQDEKAAWVEQMLAIQALSCYQDGEVYQAIKSKVTSRHWYVRTNALEYLHKQEISREEVTEILQARDRYASEALLYQYRDNQEMTLFIIHAIQKLTQEQAPNTENAVQERGFDSV